LEADNTPEEYQYKLEQWGAVDQVVEKRAVNEAFERGNGLTSKDNNGRRAYKTNHQKQEQLKQQKQEQMMESEQLINVDQPAGVDANRPGPVNEAPQQQLDLSNTNSAELESQHKASVDANKSAHEVHAAKA
jgi:hypothetical protein